MLLSIYLIIELGVKNTYVGAARISPSGGGWYRRAEGKRERWVERWMSCSVIWYQDHGFC